MSYEPKYEIFLECPFKFILLSIPELNVKTKCIKDKCALWLPIQKACSLQVVARGFKPQQKYRR